MNGGGLLELEGPRFHPGDLLFTPLPDRAVPCYPDHSIIWNILSFVCYYNFCMYTFLHNVIVVYVTDYKTCQVVESSTMDA